MVRATFKTPGAPKGEKLLFEFINEKRDRQAAYLLRDHDESAITSPETYPRDQIDQLLSCYSVLFIAIYAGAIDPTEIVNELKRIKALLDFRPLERYYSESYSLRIPQIFSYFLEGKLWLRCSCPPLQEDAELLDCGAIDAARFAERGVSAGYEDGRRIVAEIMSRLIDDYVVQAVDYSLGGQVMGSRRLLLRRL